jgi:Na+:H+ antiporter, NhaA family
VTDNDVGLPREPIDRLIGPLERFLHVEAAAGVVLLGAAVLALALANSPWAETYLAFWNTKVTLGAGSFEMSHSLRHWINDGLMAVFFFVIGLEVKREIVVGELRDPARAALPVVAAVGGMIVPAGIYFLLQHGQAGASGWGIPMATDIAFVVGCLAVLGPRVPSSLRVFLLSLAIADDIGAVLVIALGYTDNINLADLAGGIAGILFIAFLARLGARSFLVYTLLGIVVWLCFHESGVHATIAGIVLGLMVPARSYLGAGRIGRLLTRASEVFHGGGWEQLENRAAKVRQAQRAARESVPPVEYLEDLLHPWVGFVIMPVFALANAGVPVHVADFAHPVGVAVAAGLCLGKPLGVVCFAWLAVQTKLARLPDGMGWTTVLAAGCLAGIGFTMALFIAGLALDDPILDAAKVGILGASALSAGLGVTLLLTRLPRSPGSPGATPAR